jgi:hypothetical protein
MEHRITETIAVLYSPIESQLLQSLLTRHGASCRVELRVQDGYPVALVQVSRLENDEERRVRLDYEKRLAKEFQAKFPPAMLSAV